ncbi:hypothetical protein [Megalodesulfovibrio gigas]|uniref:Uncharacterized protein n=1 Tax=Megalodesulfovibrio gigas (strain ATCC 19364 / DSM 1382 / NCIMB 9332 / VKM B-1759) TaxID=1121448 RepID=T2GDF1_MEGG1|nr:hypothetical protein [Megalodesulfovibrio gigas]AGW14141.1 hypothetical protein DGI_2392 [Megalodesulfovibrio gigas DSM 1382 = ATCC 19364]
MEPHADTALPELPPSEAVLIASTEVDMDGRPLRVMTLDCLADALELHDRHDPRAWFEFRCRQFGFACGRDWIDSSPDDPLIGLSMAKVLAVLERKSPRGMLVHQAIIAHEQRLWALQRMSLVTEFDPDCGAGGFCLGTVPNYIADVVADQPDQPDRPDQAPEDGSTTLRVTVRLHPLTDPTDAPGSLSTASSTSTTQDAA